MKKLLAIMVLGLLFSGSASAEIIKLTGCPEEYNNRITDIKVDLTNKTAFIKIDYNGVSTEKVKIKKIQGVYAITEKTSRRKWNVEIRNSTGLFYKINFKDGEIRECLSENNCYPILYCDFKNGKLTKHGKVRKEIAEKPKTVAKKPEKTWTATIPEGDHYKSRYRTASANFVAYEGFYDAAGKTLEASKINARNKCEIQSRVEKNKCIYVKSWEVKNKTIVKKPKKKEPPKKQITKAPEIDGSLLTIGSGSGFYINNKGYALTNNHVVDICKQMVAVVDGREILFRVLNTDKTNDVAIIKTDQRSPNFIKINEEGAKLGEDIIAVGYPLSGRLSDSVKITRGIVSALSGIDNNSGQIQIDAALQPGNSGGPVINENGELIGIASAGLNKLLMAKEAKYIPENVNFAVSSSIVTNILKNKKVSYSTPSFFSGSFSNTELATLGDKVTLQLFCRNTRTAYNKLKRSKQYSHILIDLD